MEELSRTRRIMSASWLVVFVLVGGGLMFAIGCGSGRPECIPVTGVITYRGKPLEGASVMFASKEGRSASGTTDARGRFTLRTFGTDDGAILGEHVVCVNKSVPDPNDKKLTPVPLFISILPKRYASPLQSPLKATVTAEGPNDFSFELTDQ